MSTDGTPDKDNDTSENSPKKKEVSPKEAAISQLKREDHIQSMRERLYARGTATAQSTRHTLPRHEIHDTMETPPLTMSPREILRPEMQQVVVEESVPTAPQVGSTEAVHYVEPMTSRKGRSYRMLIILGGVVFFVVALAISAMVMFKGGNNISGENISLEITGPITVGGGEEFSYQVTIANQNAIAIQSATVIVQYPEGTQSATEAGKALSTERQQLNTIGTGELVNVPFKARIYGEENQEKQIQVRVEYRVAGSNATFEKRAEPLIFKINTSPVVINFNTVKTISSGQEVALDLIVQSNSPTPLTNILVKVQYPEGFDFTKSTPETVSGQDTWRFDTLKPNEKKTIKIKGLMTGYENETRKFNATAGVASESDRNALVSELSKAYVDIAIEKPSLTVGVSINDYKDETVIIKSGQNARVGIVFTNALNNAIYDGNVSVELSGNALNEFQVQAGSGFYDSSKNTIVWDSVDETSLKEILPGRSSSLSFTLNPLNTIGNTPEMTIKVAVKGRRVFDERTSEELAGNVTRTIKVESVPTIAASAVYNTGPFTNTGPMPPVAEKITQLTYVLTAKATKNDLTGAEIIAIMPTYMSWLDLVSEGNAVTYNTTTRTLKWNIGDISANSEKEVSVQVSLKPSLTQVGSTPTILESQRFKATDRFTGTVVRAEHTALTTSLAGEGDGSFEDGVVRARE